MRDQPIHQRFVTSKPHRLASLLLGLLLILGGTGRAALPALAQKTADGVITGSVRDAHGQHPIAGARVQLGSMIVWTDEHGVIPPTSLPLEHGLHQIDVEVTAAGYGRWRFEGVELRDDHPVELRVELDEQAQTFAPIEPMGAAAVPYNGPPDFIRVGRTFSTACVYPSAEVGPDKVVKRVDRVPFIDYVRNVLPYEWVPGWPAEALNAGAVAAAQFAWYSSEVQRKWSRYGFPYDVVDSVCDQVYKDRSPTTNFGSTDAAVARMWGTALIRNGKLIPTFFRDRDESCVRANSPDCMGQWGSYYRAQEGMNALQILHYYYDPVQDIRTAPANRGLVLQRAPQLTVVAGRSTVVNLCMRNTGTTTWLQGRTELVAVDPADEGNSSYISPFADTSWRSPQRPATQRESAAALGQSGSWRFTLTAPSSLAPGRYQLALRLQHADGTVVPTDSPLRWEIAVTKPFAATYSSYLPTIAGIGTGIVASCP